MSEAVSSKSAIQETWFSGLRGSLYVLRVPIVMAAVTVIALTIPDQVQEVYVVLAQDRVATPGLQYRWILALLALFALSLVYWQVARGLSFDFFAQAMGPPHPLARLVLRWLPRLLAAAPLLGAALGLYLSRTGTPALEGGNPYLKEYLDDLARLAADIEKGIGICIALAVVVFVITLVFEYRMRETGRTQRVATISNWVIFPIIAIVSVALLILDPVRIPQTLGVVPIFALWMAIVALLTGFLARLSIFAIPILGLALLWVAGIEVFRLADNHAFRREARPVERQAIDEAFQAWLASRKDQEAYKGRPYPVYIVAAEGGGLYAGHLAAQFLARMQDLCPSFAHHLFAVSSVSGGSLGAAVFGGLMAEQPVPDQFEPCKRNVASPGPLELRAKQILATDFLAPSIWGLLFPDFLQRFIPHPIPELDRARVLERAFETAWVGGNVNPMTRGLFDLCGAGLSGCSAGATPYLALNVSNVETGLQMVLSPLDLAAIGGNSDPTAKNPGKIYDMFGSIGVEPFHVPLSTAVGLSARFPWVSPPGWFVETPALAPDRLPRRSRTPLVKSGKARYTFVDGGYVDNSGVATALNIAQYLDTLVPPHTIEVRLIMISALLVPLDRLWFDPPLDRPQGEILPPLNAAESSRSGRGYKTQVDAAFETREGLNITETGFYYGFEILPLGWQLSDVSRKYMALFRGDPERCLANSENGFRKHIRKDPRSDERLAVSYMKRADCVVAMLRNELTPSEPRLEMPPINQRN